jgi:hypothetical protein
MASMHDVNADERIRELCRQILEEQEPSKVEELLSSLQHTVQGYQEETRTRMRYIANYYRQRLGKDLNGTEPGSERGARIRALLEFLGLGRARTEGEF